MRTRTTWHPKRRRRGLTRLVAVAAATVLVAVACGDDDDDATPPGNGDIGGELTMVRFGESRGLDPVELGGFAPGDGPTAFALYDSLMRWDEDQQAVVPQLAESLETDDFQTWTMTLREGVQFTDGTPLDAAAVIFNIERIQDTPESFGAAAAGLIASMEAPDDRTVVFHLVDVNPNYDVNFTNRLAFIASPTAIEEFGEDFSSNPVGAGPFMLDEWVRDSHLRAVRNPDYWNAPRPYLDAITFRPIPDNTQRVNMLIAGEAQLTYATDGTSIVRLQDAGLEFNTVALNGGEGLMFHTAAPPFDDAEVRRAIAHAINLDDFNNAVYEGNANIGSTLFTEDSPFFDPSAAPPGYDPDEAARIFAEYESTHGEPLSFTYNSFETASSQAIGQFLQAVLREYGVDVRIDVGDTPTAAGKVFAGDYDVTNWGLNLGGEPEPQLSQFFTSGLDGNLSRIANPELDAALAAAASATDMDSRIDAYADVQRVFYVELPFLLLNLPTEGLLSAPGVGGVKLSANGLLMSDELTAS